MHDKLARKLGIKELTENHKRFIRNAANSASVSGSVNEKAVIKGLRRIKEHVTGQKAEGKEAYEAGIRRRTRRAEKIKANYETEKGEVASELRRLTRSLGKKVPAKGSLHLAKLRAHGFTLSVADHVHLTKHLADKTTQRIKERLRHQESKNHCDKCILEDYLTIV